MAFVWALLIVLSLLSGVFCPPHETPTGVMCHHCGGRHGKYPDCLTDKHQCHDDELCYMTDKHDEIHMECWGKKDCEHTEGHNCFLDVHTRGQCEICCKDESCVNLQLAHLQGYTVAPTKDSQTKTTMTSTEKVTPTSSGSFADHLLTGPCYDTMVQGGCSDAKMAVCEDPVGVALCPETCGLCRLLQKRFHANTTCQDQLVDGQCANANSPTFCNGQLASVACPKTCSLCQSILANLIQTVVSSSHGSTLVAVTQTVVVMTTTVPPITNKLTSETPTPFTDVVTQQTTNVACFDDVNDCHSLPDVCNNLLADRICKKFCNLCPTATPN